MVSEFCFSQNYAIYILLAIARYLKTKRILLLYLQYIYYICRMLNLKTKKMTTKEAQQLINDTNNTMITYACRVGVSVIDGARTEEEANKWCDDMLADDPDYFKEVEDKPNYIAIVIDDNTGVEVTKNNLRQYLK